MRWQPCRVRRLELDVALVPTHRLWRVLNMKRVPLSDSATRHGLSLSSSIGTLTGVNDSSFHIGSYGERVHEVCASWMLEVTYVTNSGKQKGNYFLGIFLKPRSNHGAVESASLTQVRLGHDLCVFLVSVLPWLLKTVRMNKLILKFHHSG